MDALIVLVGTVLAVAMLRWWPRPDMDRVSLDEWARVRDELDREMQ